MNFCERVVGKQYRLLREIWFHCKLIKHLAFCEHFANLNFAEEPYLLPPFPGPQVSKSRPRAQAANGPELWFYIWQWMHSHRDMNQYLSLRWHTLEREYIGRRSDIFAVVLFWSFPAFSASWHRDNCPPPSLSPCLSTLCIAENCSPTLLLAGDGHKTAKMFLYSTF